MSKKCYHVVKLDKILVSGGFEGTEEAFQEIYEELCTRLKGPAKASDVNLAEAVNEANIYVAKRQMVAAKKKAGKNWKLDPDYVEKQKVHNNACLVKGLLVVGLPEPGCMHQGALACRSGFLVAFGLSI